MMVLTMPTSSAAVQFDVPGRPREVFTPGTPGHRALHLQVNLSGRGRQVQHRLGMYEPLL